jgi:hypothetical protein
VKCSVQGKDLATVFCGHYLLIDPVKESAVITISFPVREEKQTFTLADYGYKGSKLLDTYRYDLTFRANTAIKVVPSVEGGKSYDGIRNKFAPAYSAYDEREQFRQTRAPMKTVERYATDIVIPTW